MPKIDGRLLYVIEKRGKDLFRTACEHDLEGIVGKWKRGSYRSDGSSTSWAKIKNADYSQIEGRAELLRAQWQAAKEINPYERRVVIGEKGSPRL
jgi:ATP-dependent DNA ligase